MSTQLSPMVKQFYDLKAKHPNAVLLFRCGDFYETYGNDAKKASDTLGITLTKSSKTLDKDGKPLRMAGFPYHALDVYLPKLIKAGHRIAICDQLEDPNQKKLVKRGVTETIGNNNNNETTNQMTPLENYLEKCRLYAEASKAYYVDSKPIMTDEQFDALQKDIRSMLDTNPEFINECNPFATPQDDHVEGFKKVQRTNPMLSLRDIYTREEVETWWNSVGNVPVSVEAKLDGCSLSLIYKGGLLKEASTRGTGYEGDDVTAQAMNISNIPERIVANIDCEVRGEVTMPIATWKAWNEAHPNNKLANPRNAASGALKTLDPQAVIDKGLQFNAYYLFHKAVGLQIGCFTTLETMGFDTLPHQSYVATTLDEIMWAIENVQTQRNDYEMQIDGVVLKVNDISKWSALGNTDKFHKFGIAFKFTHELTKSPLKYIDWQLSQDGTGRLSPVGVYDFVEMCGTNCHRVTLNNIDLINERYPGIHIGDYLMLTKGGDIIPRNDGFEAAPDHDPNITWQVVQSEKSEVGTVMRQTSGLVVAPKTCPVCGMALIRQGAFMYCTNKCVGHNKEIKPKKTEEPKPQVEVTGSSLAGKVFYITGKFYDANGKHDPQRRKDLQAMVIANGGSVQDKFLASRCDYLVCGDNAGSAKVTAMQGYCKGKQVINEQQFLDMIK